MTTLPSGTAAKWTPSKALAVYLGDVHVGHLAARGLTSWFQFTEEYVHQMRDRPVLGLRFEEGITRTHYGHDALPTWFTNLLPEGQLRHLYGAAAGVLGEPDSLDTEWSILERVGLDLPGAIRVAPVDVSEISSPAPPVDHTDTKLPSAGQHDSLRFSVAGVGMKLSMLKAGERFTVPASGIGGLWLVKLPDPNFPDLPANEYTIMSLADAVGIDTPAIRLVHRDEVHHEAENLWGNQTHAYAIERFDRATDGSRIHIEDLAQVRGVRPSEKYKSSFETAASFIYRGRNEASLIEFTKRLTFSLLVGNGDAHLKNWSLIYTNPQVPTLSPAYDIVSLAPYWRYQNLDTSMGLSLHRNRRFDRVTLDHFAKLGDKLGVGQILVEVAVETTARTLDNLGVIDSIQETPSEMKRSISEHVTRMSAQLK